MDITFIENATMTSHSVPWQRKNHIVSLSPTSVDLVRRYTALLTAPRRDDDDDDDKESESSVDILSADEILQRVQRVATLAAAATTNATTQQQRYGSSAEYRCLETGGFLVPSVSHHPWYKDSVLRTTKLLAACRSSGRGTAVLDVGCGMGADGRRMLLDGFATTVVGVDRNSLYMRLGCDLFGDNPEEIVVPKMTDSATITMSMKRHLLQCTSRVVFLTANIAEKEQLLDTTCNSSKDAISVVNQVQMVLQEQIRNQNETCDRIQLTNPNMVQTIKNDRPQFEAVYAGKFFHCLETEENFRIALGNIRALLVTGGCLFGVFGRNYSPAFECASKDNLSRVMSSEGFVVAMLQEEAAGATWFCVYKRGEE